MGPDASTSIAISGRTIRGLVAMLASSCPNRSRSDVSDDWSSEDHQMAHVEALLRRTEPGHPDAATFPGRRRLDVVYRRSEGPDLDARSDHACIIGIRRPSGIVPRFQPNTTPVRTRPVPETIPHLLPDALAAGSASGSLAAATFCPAAHEQSGRRGSERAFWRGSRKRCDRGSTLLCVVKVRPAVLADQ